MTTPTPATSPEPLVDTDPLVIERTAATNAQIDRLEEAARLSYRFRSPRQLTCIVALLRWALKEGVGGPWQDEYAETLVDFEAVQQRLG